MIIFEFVNVLLCLSCPSQTFKTSLRLYSEIHTSSHHPNTQEQLLKLHVQLVGCRAPENAGTWAHVPRHIRDIPDIDGYLCNSKELKLL